MGRGADGEERRVSSSRLPAEQGAPHGARSQDPKIKSWTLNQRSYPPYARAAAARARSSSWSSLGGSPAGPDGPPRLLGPVGGGEGAVAPRRRSAPRGAQVVAPAGAGERLRPMRIGGCASWRRDVREAAVEREAQGQPGPQPLPGPHLQGGRRQQRSPRGERWGATCRLGRSTPSR